MGSSWTTIEEPVPPRRGSRFAVLARAFTPGTRELRAIPPPLVPVLAFLLLTLVGLLVLVLPFSNRDGGFTPILDALFAAASATTTTGLTTQDVTAFWTMPGQITLLLLVFIGGLGYSVVASLLLLNVGHRISSILNEDTGHTPYLGNGTRLAVRISLVVVGIQVVGFLVLFVRFSLMEPMSDAIWEGILDDGPCLQ